MQRRTTTISVAVAMILALPALADDWTRFRGPTGMGTSDEQGLPTTWSSTENVVWKTPTPGPGASSPITLGDKVFLTSYSGYGIEPSAGDQKNLVRHLFCLDRKTGRLVWRKQLHPKFPEHEYQGEGSYHGYAASTPTTDGKNLYVFFGKSGVYCFDLAGNQRWHANVGSGVNRWGSGCSPILHGNLLIVNASVESGSLVALNKNTGKEVWRASGIASAWNTPLVTGPKGKPELVLGIQDHVLGFDPRTGSELWRAEGVHRYVCPSVIAHGNVVYAIGGGHTSLAVRASARGQVTESQGVWREKKGSNVSSPVYHQGHLYWANDSIVCCQNAATGATVYQERLKPSAGRVWSSPVLADGKIYFVSQHNGTYVLAAKPEFELLAHNVFADDDSRANASPALGPRTLYLRTDRYLYRISSQQTVGD